MTYLLACSFQVAVSIFPSRYVLFERKIREKRDMARFRVPIRVLVAFLCGWVIAFSNIIGVIIEFLSPYARAAWNMYSDTLGFLLFLALSLLLGVAAALSVNWRKKYAFPLALLTMLSVSAGFYAYQLPGALRSDAQPCDISCQHGLIGRNATGLLFFVWFLTVLLAFASLLITSLIIYAAKYLSRKWLLYRQQRGDQEGKR